MKKKHLRRGGGLFTSARVWAWVWHSRRICRRINRRFWIAGWQPSQRQAAPTHTPSFPFDSGLDLWGSAVGDTIGHFTMRRLALTRLPIALSIATLLLPLASVAGAQIDPV